MSERILFVDDEPNVLDGIRRQLRKKYDVHTADSGEAGLKCLEAEGPFPVVVSDMRMPGMNGAQFLKQVREAAPDSVRLILSGHSDLEAAIAAVNEGNLFRFLVKPCDAEALVSALELALDQYRLVTGRRELLERTLGGSIEMLTELLGLAQPQAFSRATRLQELMEAAAEKMQVPDPWEFRLAALFSQIGCISLTPEVVAKAQEGRPLSPTEREMYAQHPAVAARLLAKIPRLQRVAVMVERQMQPADPEMLQRKPSEWSPEELGAQTLRAVTALDRLLNTGKKHAAAVAELARQEPPIPPALREILGSLTAAAGTVTFVSRSASVEDLLPGMLLEADVRANSGVLLARKGQTISETMLTRLKNFHYGVGVQEPVQVLVEA